MYNFLEHLFTETGFPVHVAFGGLIFIVLYMVIQEERKH